jgi:SAM-dependent methyltransferase
MPGKHVYDPTFLYSSHELKDILANLRDVPMSYCLDMPCGNGRNLFLLATHFTNLVGIDINEAFLNNIQAVAPEYHQSRGAIHTRKMDLMNDLPEDIDHFDFITTIHYYNYSLLRRVIDGMKKGALFYIETQSCAGNNYKELPMEEEVKFLFKDLELLLYKSHHCPSSPLSSKSITFKALVRKAYDCN